MQVVLEPSTQDSSCFEDRFEGYALESVTPVDWPVYEHTLSVVTPISVQMNMFEHAFLSLVTSGVGNKEDVKSFLGIGPRYFEQLVQELSGSNGRIVPLVVCSGEELSHNTETASALSNNSKTEFQTRKSAAYRDAMFGLPLIGVPETWVNSAHASACVLKLAPLADPLEKPDSRWHRPYVDSIKEKVITRTEISETGHLRWARLMLASYMTERPKSGRILLFNPADDNRPLHELSAKLEALLLSGKYPKPYQPGLDSLILRWIHLREAIQGNLHKAEIARHEQTILELSEKETLTSRSVEAHDLEALVSEKRALEKKVEQLQDLLNQGPQITHIETKDHPIWLRSALEKAEFTLIIISPWIKMRVLEQLLPDIEEALNRQCEIWIGHGMPPSASHRDSSDQAALDALDELSSRTRLLHRVPDLNTHEKILICDNSYIISTSYNWLSFKTGSGYDRYEHGIVHEGPEVRSLKEQYLRRLRALRSAPLPPSHLVPIM